MKNYILIGSLIVLFACNNQDNHYPETAMDTGRNFIRASLDGNFNEAEKYILNTQENSEYFATFKQHFQSLPDSVRASYKKASFEINEYNEVNDTVTIIHYSNSYMKKNMNIQLIRRNNKWSIDLHHSNSEKQ
jgi:hypothetical protein